MTIIITMVILSLSLW